MRSDRFGFVVHPLSPAQRRLLAVRTTSPSLFVERASNAETARLVADLNLSHQSGVRITGCLASVTQLPHELLEDQATGVRAIARAAQLCVDQGATVVGLGAVAAMIGGQGKAVNRLVGVPITSGNACTAVAACETVELALSRLQTDPEIYLLGPPGPVANAILELLVRRGLSIKLVQERPPTPLLKLTGRLNELGYGSVTFVDDVQAALGPGRLLIAASSTGGRLRSSELPAGSIVIDVAEPLDVIRDTPPRGDILLLEGEYVRPPAPLKGDIWRTIYGLVTGQRRHLFACFVEPMVLCLGGRTDLAHVGRAVPYETLTALGDEMSRLGFWVDELFEAGVPVSQARLRRFSEP